MISYLFDVDGTLTYPREKMRDAHVSSFLSWVTDKKVFIVAGSDRKKVLEQLPASVLARCSGVFCCMANELWSNADTFGSRHVYLIQKPTLVYRNDWKPPIELIADLARTYLQSHYPRNMRATNYIEERTGMLNFSIVGRTASNEQRNHFSNWDKQEKERERIVKDLSSKYSNLDFRIGGQISIDIQPKNANKSQASKWVRENCGPDMIFFGDKCDKNGNDYDIVKDIEKHEKGKVFCVKSPTETLELLTGNKK